MRKQIIKDWLEKLPEPARTLAFKNCENENNFSFTMRHALRHAFDWEKSPEGNQFWMDLYLTLPETKVSKKWEGLECPDDFDEQKCFYPNPNVYVYFVNENDQGKYGFSLNKTEKYCFRSTLIDFVRYAENAGWYAHEGYGIPTDYLDHWYEKMMAE